MRRLATQLGPFDVGFVKKMQGGDVGLILVLTNITLLPLLLMDAAFLWDS